MILKFTKAQADFLKKELGFVVRPDIEVNFDLETRRDLAYKCFDIEDQEVPIGNEPLSERGELAVSLVDLLSGVILRDDSEGFVPLIKS